MGGAAEVRAGERKGDETGRRAVESIKGIRDRAIRVEKLGNAGEKGDVSNPRSRTAGSLVYEADLSSEVRQLFFFLSFSINPSVCCIYRSASQSLDACCSPDCHLYLRWDCVLSEHISHSGIKLSQHHWDIR